MRAAISVATTTAVATATAITTATTQVSEKYVAASSSAKLGVNINKSLNYLNNKCLIPMTQEEEEHIMQTYQTVDKFIDDRRYKIAKERNLDTRKLTNTSLGGCIYSIPDNAYNVFLRLLAREIAKPVVNGKIHYNCEFLTDIFKMFCDLDIESDRELTEQDFLDILKVLQQDMSKLFPKSDIEMITFTTSVEKKEIPTAEQGDVKYIYRYGLHPIWHLVKVNQQMALESSGIFLSGLVRSLPKPQAPSNSWANRLDKDVYGILGSNKVGGLRLPGNHKFQDCKACTTSTADNCKACKGVRRIAVGRPYRAQWVIDKNGQIDEAKTLEFRKDWYLALKLGSLRLPFEQVPNMDYNPPENAAVVYNKELDPNYLKMLETPKLDKNGKPIKPRKIQSSVLDKNPHLARYLEFPDNLQDWRSKPASRYKFRLEGDAVKLLIQDAIRDYNINYKEAIVIDVRCDKKQFPCNLKILIDGQGSSYCLNKGANHYTGQVYFMINTLGEMWLGCTNKKNKIRPGAGRICSEYRSVSRRVPELLNNILLGNSKGHFKDGDDEVKFEKYRMEISQQLHKVAIQSLIDDVDADTDVNLGLDHEASANTDVNVDSDFKTGSELKSGLNLDRVDDKSVKLQQEISRIKRAARKQFVLDKDYLFQLCHLSFIHKKMGGILDERFQKVEEEDVSKIKMVPIYRPILDLPKLNKVDVDARVDINEYDSNVVDDNSDANSDDDEINVKKRTKSSKKRPRVTTHEVVPRRKPRAKKAAK